METMMSKCLNCGWQAARNVQFCPQCGAAVIHGDNQNTAASNPPSEFSNTPVTAWGYSPQQTGNQYIPNADSQNYGSTPQSFQPPIPGGAEEQPVSQNPATDRIYQQFFGTDKKPSEQQSPTTSYASSDPAAEAFSTTSDSAPAPDYMSFEQQPAPASPKPDERWTSFAPPEDVSEKSASASSKQPTRAYSEPFKPSVGTNKGADYILSSIDASWKLLLILWILLLLIFLLLALKGESFMGETCLIVFIAGIPIISTNYTTAKVLGTFYEMANDVSAIHSSLDMLREEQYKERTGSK